MIIRTIILMVTFILSLHAMDSSKDVEKSHIGKLIKQRLAFRGIIEQNIKVEETLRYNLDGIKDLLLDTDEPIEDCKSMLLQLDFEDDNIQEIEVDRLEAAGIYIKLGMKEDALFLLDFNINGKKLPYNERLYSLMLATFSSCIEEEGGLERRIAIVEKDAPIEDIQSILGLVMLINKIGNTNKAQKLWDSVHKVDDDNLWEFHLKKLHEIGIWQPELEFTNPFEIDDISLICPLWEMYMRVHTQRNISNIRIIK